MVVLALGVYANTFQHGFTFDDLGVILHNPAITDWRRIPKLFTQGYWSHLFSGVGNYRPLTMTTFAVEYTVWGEQPAGYHVVNVILHVLNTWLLFHLLRLYHTSPWVAGVAAMIFAVHPVHTEAVAGIVGRAELLGFFFGGLMWWSWRRAAVTRTAVGWWRVAAAAAYLGALLSKENFIVLPAALWLAEVLRRRRRLTTPAAWFHLTVPFGVFVLPLVVYFQLRALAGEGFAQTSGVGDIPLDGYTLGQRIVAMAGVSVEWYRLVVIGYPLKPWYDGLNVNIEPVWTWRATLGAVAVTVLAALGLATWRRAPLVAFAVGLWFITLALVSNIPIPLGTLVAERWLYAPSAGYAIAVGYGAWRLWRRPSGVYRIMVVVWLGVMVGGYAYGATRRNLDWRNNFTLFRRFIETDPGHPLGYINTANFFIDTNRPLARKLYETALQLDPRSIVPQLQLAQFDIEEQQWAAAGARLERLLARKPPNCPVPSRDWGVAHALYARALAASGAATLAEQEVELALRYGADDANVLLTVGATFLQLKRHDEAVRLFERLVERFPNNVAYQQRLEEALRLQAGS